MLIVSPSYQYCTYPKRTIFQENTFKSDYFKFIVVNMPYIPDQYTFLFYCSHLCFFFTEEKTPGNYTFKFDSSILNIINLTKIDGNANSLLFVILCNM